MFLTNANDRAVNFFIKKDIRFNLKYIVVSHLKDEVQLRRDIVLDTLGSVTPFVLPFLYCLQFL